MKKYQVQFVVIDNGDPEIAYTADVAKEIEAQLRDEFVDKFTEIEQVSVSSEAAKRTDADKQARVEVIVRSLTYGTLRPTVALREILAIFGYEVEQ